MKPFTKEAFERALDGDYSLLKAVPKADLHAHGLLSSNFNYVRRINPSIKMPPNNFASFEEFIDYINMNYFATNDISEYEFKLYEAALLTMIDDGIVYTEMSFDLTSASSAKISWDNFAWQIKELQAKYSNSITLCPELGIHRATANEFWKEELPKALATNIFGSTDLYGDYNAGLVKDFTVAFDMAKDAGLKIKYHSGELAEADRIEEDISEYEPEAIQHGITSLKHPVTLNRIVEKEIMCNVCVTSNIKLAGIGDIKRHPVRAMFDAGIRISLGTDDLSVFGSSLTNEYLMLYKHDIFTVEELELIRINGIKELERYKKGQ